MRRVIARAAITATLEEMREWERQCYEAKSFTFARAFARANGIELKEDKA